MDWVDRVDEDKGQGKGEQPGKTKQREATELLIKEKTTTVQEGSTLRTRSDIWIHLAPAPGLLPRLSMAVSSNMSSSERTEEGQESTPHPTNKQKKEEDWNPWLIHSQRRFFSDLCQILSHALSPVFHFGLNGCGFLCTFQHQETGR